MSRRRRWQATTAGHLATCGVWGECQCRDVAYHEAGHAVVAWALEVRVLSVDLRSLRGDLGVHRGRRRLFVPDQPQAIALGGDLAEMLLRHEAQPCGDETLDVIERHGLDVAKVYAHEVRDLLLAHWRRVDALARALLGGRRLLFGAEARRVKVVAA